MTTSAFLTPDKTGYIPVVYTTKDGQELTLTIDDIKRFLVRGNPEKATIQELVFFAGVCRARGMDPYAGDCYLIKYSDDPAAIVTARAYFEARAKAQKDCKGWKAGIIVIDDDGDGKEIKRIGALPRPGDKLIGGWFEGHSDKWEFPLELEVSLPMYIKKTRDGHITQFWKPEKQAHMIRKVALVQGLRELWPNEFAGLYAPDEMGPETPEPEAITLEPSEVTVTETDQPVAHEDLKADLEKKKAEDAEKAAQEKAEADAKAEEEAAAKEAEAVERRALVKTFDAKTEAAKLTTQQVNDYLFKKLEQVGEGVTIEDLKIQMVKQGVAGSVAKEIAEFYAKAQPQDAEEIVKMFKMQKKQGFFAEKGDKNIYAYEAQKETWPLEAQVAYANKVKDMSKAYPEEFAAAWAKIYPEVEAAATGAGAEDPGPALKPCDRCGAETEGELCANCQADEAGEGGEPERRMFYQYLEKCAEVKKQLVERFGKESGEKKYYAVLGSHGFEKSNMIEDRAKQKEVVTELYDLLK